MIRAIPQSKADRDLLRKLIAKGIPTVTEQPRDYQGVAVMKPWGYEFQSYDNGHCSVWIVCLKAGQAVSMHCHQRKEAMFIPLTSSIMLRTLDVGVMVLWEGICIDKGVFHSQENNTDEDAFFMEYEWPSEKTDLVRYKDRYGRENKGYESKSEMVPLYEAAMNMPEHLRYLAERVA